MAGALLPPKLSCSQLYVGCKITLISDLQKPESSLSPALRLAVSLHVLGQVWIKWLAVEASRRNARAACDALAGAGCCTHSHISRGWQRNSHGQQQYRAASWSLWLGQNRIRQPAEQIYVANRNRHQRQYLQENKYKYKGTAKMRYYGKEGSWAIGMTQAQKETIDLGDDAGEGKGPSSASTSHLLKEWCSLRAGRMPFCCNAEEIFG